MKFVIPWNSLCGPGCPLIRSNHPASASRSIFDSLCFKLAQCIFFFFVSVYPSVTWEEIHDAVEILACLCEDFKGVFSYCLGHQCCFRDII